MCWNSERVFFYDKRYYRKGLECCFFIIERVGVEDERIEKLKMLRNVVIFFNVYYVLRFGKFV